MAGKITEMTQLSVPALEDLFEVVDDPSGTPLTRSVSGTRLGGLLSRTVQGRLTTESGKPVSTSDRTSQGTIYFTPYNGNLLSVYDGTRWRLYTFSEISLSLTGLIPNGVVSNVFVYDNSGTLTLELGHWLNSTVTITIASPGVVSWTSHGLSDGDSIVFSTTGALPTGLTAGTTYFVLNKTADTFQVAATSGGTAINTSGSQSGTHTAYVTGLGVSSAASHDTVRALTTQDGVYVKSGATTRRWLGVIKASGTDVIEDSAAKRFLWNAFNAVSRGVRKTLSTVTWTYSSTTKRYANNDATARVEVVLGAVGQAIFLQNMSGITNTVNTVGLLGIGIDRVSTADEDSRARGGFSVEGPAVAALRQATGLGCHFYAWIEYCAAAGASPATFIGNNEAGFVGVWPC